MKTSPTQILAVVGSPRKNGNTHLVIEKILEGARENGALTDTLLLGDFMIRECNGCHACWKTGKCSLNDDMNAIYPKIIQSEIILLGSPVYWYGPTALMKCFIDRLAFFNGEANRQAIRGKKGVMIIPYEEKDPETVKPVIAFFEKTLQYLEIELIYQLIVPGVTQRGEVSKYPEIITKAYELGKRIAVSVLK